jgi:hypothetical protein
MALSVRESDALIFLLASFAKPKIALPSAYA